MVKKMKFLLVLILVYTCPLLLNSFRDYSWDTNPFICTWTLEKGKSFYKCNDGSILDDDGAINKAVQGKGYTSMKKKIPDDVKWSSGFAINAKHLKDGLLDKLNEYHRKHGGGDMRYDKNLETGPQQRVEEIMASYNGVSPDSSNSDGENIGCGQKDDIYGIIDKWYKQSEKYNFDDPEGNRGKGVNDFTRMVWQGSYSVGCGIEHKGPIYCLVCAFSPPGNNPGQYMKNVRKAHETVLIGFGKK